MDTDCRSPASEVLLRLIKINDTSIEYEIENKNELKPAFAAMHGPHSLVRIGPGCADRA